MSIAFTVLVPLLLLAFLAPVFFFTF